MDARVGRVNHVLGHAALAAVTLEAKDDVRLAHPVLAILAEAALATGDDLLGHHVVADDHVVPLEVEQAAHIDGLSRFGVLWHISIPLARASIFVVAIFTWIFSWNELLDALVLTSGATETLPVFLSKFASNTLTAYQQMAAVATVQILPAVIITFFAQRYIVAGLSMGALSGE